MPDIGVLNLQIHDNSEQAATGLGRLADALTRVREAVRGGLKLSGVAKNIRDIAKAVDESVSASTISKLGEFADQLAKLNGLGNIKINIKDTGNFSSAMESIQNGISGIDDISGMFERANSRISEATEGFRGFANEVEHVNEIFQKVDFGNGYQQFRSMLDMFVRMRSAMALGSGTQLSTDVEKGWTLWKDGAIEVEGTVSETYESIEQGAERLKLPSGTEVFKSIEDAARALGISVDEVKRRLQETYHAVYDNQGTPVYSSIEEAARAMGISVEEAKRKILETQEAVFGKTVESPRMFETIDESVSETDGLLDLLRRKVAILREEVLKGRTEKGTILSEKAIINAQIQIDSLMKKIGKLEDAKRNARGYGDTLVDSLVGDYSKIDLLQLKLDSMQRSLINDINANKVDTQQIADRAMRIQDLKDKIEKLKMEQDGLAESTSKGTSVWKKLGDGISKIFPSLNGLLSKFKQIVKYRLLRGVLKHITEGFSEGVQNVYQYSKAIGSSFAPSMNSAASAILQMKNSIGAAVAPAIQSLIPILQTVVSWFITAVNYVNQFLSLLRGQQTWTRALPATANAFDKQKKAAKGASAAMKDLLADWDELNIIQSNTSGAGSGTGTRTAEDYLKMFEEVSTFDNKVKDIFKFAKDHLGEIKTIAAGIGAAILGWKISKAFSEDLPLIGKIGSGITAGATVAITLALTNAFGEEYAQGGGVGWLIADALTGAVGSYLAGQLVKKIAGGAAGKVTSGFTLVLSGLINVKNAKTAMENQNEGKAWALAALGSAETGIGSALIAKGLLAAGTAASITAGVITGGLTLAITAGILLEAKRNATYKKMAYDAFSKTGENGIDIDKYKEELQKRVDALTKNMSVVANLGIELGTAKEEFNKSFEVIESFNAFLTSGETLTTEEARQFKEAWDTVFSSFDKLGKLSYQTIFSGLQEAIKNGSKEIREAATNLKKEAVDVARITGGARAAAKEEMDQIVQEMSAGDTSRIDRYMELYNIWGGDKSSKEIRKRVDDIVGARVKFTEGGNPVEDVQNFLADIQKNSVDPALELANQQYAAEIAGIEEQKDELKKAFESGYIDKSAFDNSTLALDKLSVLFKNRLDEQVKEITGAVDTAYNTIAEQLYEGFFNLPDDNVARQKYIDEVINPILKVYEAAGREIPKRIQNILTLGSEGLSNSSMNASFAGKNGRQELYQMAYDEIRDSIGSVGVGGIVNRIIASEGLNMESHGPITAIDRNEILNALLPLFPEIKAWDVMKFLNDQYGDLYGFNIEEMLAGINLNSFAGRKYTLDDGTEYEYDVQEMIDNIREGLADYNYDNPLNAIDLPEAFIDWPVTLNPVVNTTGEEYGVDIDTSDANITGRRFNPNNLRASAGYSDANFGMYHGTTGAITDETQLTSSVQKGTENMANRVESALGLLLSAVNTLSRRPINVNLSPSSGFGMWGRRNSNMLANVTGTDEP